MKNRFYYILLALFIIQACKGTEKEVLSPAEVIIQLEEKHRTSNDVNDANTLINAYANYASSHPDDISTNSKYLRRSAQIYNNTEEYMKAAGTTVLALKQYYKSSATESNVASLVDYYLKLDNQDAAETTMNGYLMAYPNGSKAADYVNKLGDKKQTLVDRLNQIGTEVVISADGTPGLNKEAVNKFIGVAEIYALTNSTRDTLASDYLFKAGKLAMTIGNNEKAMECYQWLYTSLKSSKEAPSALFTHAFTLDNQLGKKEEARGLYEKFLKTYPQHHFADDSEFQLKNLGKNDAQIIEEFNKRASSK